MAASRGTYYSFNPSLVTFFCSWYSSGASWSELVGPGSRAVAGETLLEARDLASAATALEVTSSPQTNISLKPCVAYGCLEDVNSRLQGRGAASFRPTVPTAGLRYSLTVQDTMTTVVCRPELHRAQATSFATYPDYLTVVIW